MLCDECGQNQATIRISTIIGENKKEENLCPQCLKKRNAQILGGLKVGDLLSQLLGAQPQAEPKETLRCDACGQTYEEFQKSGRLGCANCYAAFGDNMKKTLKSIHGHAHHVGKVPAYLEGERLHRQQVDDLKRQMDQAVAAEDFERAAVLRDRIRDLSTREKAPDGKEGGA